MKAKIPRKLKKALKCLKVRKNISRFGVEIGYIGKPTKWKNKSTYYVLRIIRYRKSLMIKEYFNKINSQVKAVEN